VTGSRWEAATLPSIEEALTQLDSELGYGASKAGLGYGDSASVKAPLAYIDTAPLAYPLDLALDAEALTCASSEQPFTFTPTSTSTGARREGLESACGAAGDSACRAPPALDSACRPPPFHSESACIHTESPCAGRELLESAGGQDELMSAQRPKCVEAQVEEAAGAGRNAGPGAGGGAASATALQDKLPLVRQKNLCHGCSAHTHADDHLVLPMFLYCVYVSSYYVLT
jgi:hypothetical protein